MASGPSAARARTPQQKRYRLDRRGGRVRHAACCGNKGAVELACARADVPLIIDSAAGFGATAEDGTPVGAGGDIEVVSFHATKPFAVGEGGAVFTRRKDTYEQLLTVSNFGFAPDRSLVTGAALNAKMSEVHAEPLLLSSTESTRSLPSGGRRLSRSAPGRVRLPPGKRAARVRRGSSSQRASLTASTEIAWRRTSRGASRSGPITSRCTAYQRCATC